MNSPHLFLLVICAISYLAWLEAYKLYWFFQRSSFFLNDFVFNFIDFWSNFYCLSSCTFFGFNLPFSFQFPNVEAWDYLIIDLINIPTHVCVCVYTNNILNLLPNIAFTTFHKFLISCIFILFKMFFIVLEISSLTHMLFRSVFFFFFFPVSKYLGFLQLFLLSISTLILLCSERRHPFFTLLIFLKCVSWPRMSSFLVNAPAWEECVFCCCQMKQSIDVDYIQLIDGAFEFNYVITDFLPAGSVHFW